MQRNLVLFALQRKVIMKNTDTGFQVRLSIDARLDEMKLAAQSLSQPRSGWIKMIRQALGMSSTDLAKRLGIGVSSVSRLEQSEVDKTIKLETLQKVADQLGCEVVYALVPRQELDKTINQRALQIASEHAVETQKSMSLEDQRIDSKLLEKLIAKEAQNLIGSKILWKFGEYDSIGSSSSKR
jgi:predicted DNA-binding mobile mystery protein A